MQNFTCNLTCPSKKKQTLYSFKTTENLWFSGVFRGFKMRILAKNGLKPHCNSLKMLWPPWGIATLLTKFRPIFYLLTMRRTKRSLYEKQSFLSRISSGNMTISAENCGIGHIYWKNPYRETSFFVQSVF